MPRGPQRKHKALNGKKILHQKENLKNENRGEVGMLAGRIVGAVGVRKALSDVGVFKG
jgi:hypothetical protein